MTLAMEESLVEALNPIKWLAIMTGVGWPYLAVIGLCLVIFLSEGYAAYAVKGLLPLPVAIVAIGIISNYALVMTFHLMGYLLYQYHEEIGFVPEAAKIERPTMKADPTQVSLDEVGALVREGKLEEATERVRGMLRGHGGSPAVHAQYRKLLRAADNKAGLLEHGRDDIVNLIDRDDDRAAVELLRECQALDPAFAPATALQVTKLAHMASRQNQPQAALLLVQDFHERFPKSQYVAANCLLAAEVLHEHMSQDEKACELLRYVKANAPDDPLMPEIDAKLQAIERMIAATRKPERPQS
jgi:tetratricopeptide (TPR) repeat protein